MPSSYRNSQNKEQPMFELTTAQAKQVLARESKFVRKAVIKKLEELEQINFFRKQEGNRAELQHKDLMKIIRDEFEEEIAEGNISPGSYKDKKGYKQCL